MPLYIYILTLTVENTVLSLAQSHLRTIDTCASLFVLIVPSLKT